jgi:hypothetical protein
MSGQRPRGRAPQLRNEDDTSLFVDAAMVQSCQPAQPDEHCYADRKCHAFGRVNVWMP